MSWIIRDKETGESDGKEFDTKFEAEAAFEAKGGDYDYYEIVEAKPLKDKHE